MPEDFVGCQGFSMWTHDCFVVASFMVCVCLVSLAQAQRRPAMITHKWVVALRQGRRGWRRHMVNLRKGERGQQ